VHCLSVTFVAVFLNLYECSIDLMFGHQCRHEVPKPHDVSKLLLLFMCCYSFIIYIVFKVWLVQFLHFAEQLRLVSDILCILDF